MWIPIRHVDPIDIHHTSSQSTMRNDRCKHSMHVKGIQDTVTSFEVVVSIPAPTYKRQKITFTTPISVRCNGGGKSRVHSTCGELTHVCCDGGNGCAVLLCVYTSIIPIRRDWYTKCVLCVVCTAAQCLMGFDTCYRTCSGKFTLTAHCEYE
jgi:hypothetical protein